MRDCFQNIVGLSSRDCDCHAVSRPSAGAEAWQLDVAVVDADGSFVFETDDPLPEDTTTASLQVFKNGELLTVDVDFEATDTAELTVSGCADGDYIQVWYKAASPQTGAYRYSVSGLYISDLLPEEELSGLAGCDETIWDLIERGRENGIREFKAALNATLQRRNTLKYHTFNGNIGRADGTGHLASAKAYAGLHIRTNGLRSGYLKINRILAMFQASGTLNITIYNRFGHVVAPAFSVVTKAGQKSITDVSVKLPLLGGFSDEQHYFVVYEYDAANKPLLNKAACSSCAGFSPSRDTEYPAFAERRDKHAWANYLVCGGWEGDSITDFSAAPQQVSEYMNGLSLEVEIGCDLSSGLCGLLDGFDSNPWAMSVATAIQRKSAAWLVDRRLSSSKANRNNAVNKDDLRAQVGKWEAEYAEILQYLSNNIPPDVNECLECSPRVRMGAIMA